MSLRIFSSLPIWGQLYSLNSLLLFYLAMRRGFMIFFTYSFLWFSLLFSKSIMLYLLYFMVQSLFAVSYFSVLCRQATGIVLWFFFSLSITNSTLIVLFLKRSNFFLMIKYWSLAQIQTYIKPNLHWGYNFALLKKVYSGFSSIFIYKYWRIYIWFARAT